MGNQDAHSVLLPQHPVLDGVRGLAVMMCSISPDASGEITVAAWLNALRAAACSGSSAFTSRCPIDHEDGSDRTGALVG
jgi:hypothetical protein